VFGSHGLIADRGEHQEVIQIPDESIKPTPRRNLRPGSGLLLANWDDVQQLGEVHALGIALRVSPSSLSGTGALGIDVIWRSVDNYTLKPNPSGRQFWRSSMCFEFPPGPAERYALADRFAEHFPDKDGFEFTPPPRSIRNDSP